MCRRALLALCGILVSLPLVSGQSPAPVATVVRWSPAGEASRQFLVSGHRARVLLHEGIAILAYLESTDDPFRVFVLVVNESGKAVDVIPDGFTLTVSEPKVKALAYVSAKALKKRIDNEAMWLGIAEAINAFGATTRSSTSGTFRVTDPERGTIFGTYNGLTTSRDSAAARQQLTANLATISATAEEEKIRQLTGVLLANTVFDGQSFGGLVHFKREKRARTMLLRMPIGGAVFEFPIEPAR
jgi:hypothetical protein